MDVPAETGVVVEGRELSTFSGVSRGYGGDRQSSAGITGVRPSLSDSGESVIQCCHTAPHVSDSGESDNRGTENGMYVNAIRVYQKLLEREDLSEQRKGFAASVRYNLGCAYSYLFQMEKAQECFLEAYREAHSKDALKAYIIAYSSVHDKTDYDKVMEELEVDEELKKDIKEEIRQSLKAFESVPEEKTDEKNLDALLERLMKDYHRSTGS